MIPPNEQVARLEALLTRIQENAARPRPPRRRPSAPPRSRPTETGLAPAAAIAEALAAATALSSSPPPMPPADALERGSGEFATASGSASAPVEGEAELLELEELGPADDQTDEPVVEIELEEEALGLDAGEREHSAVIAAPFESLHESEMTTPDPSSAPTLDAAPVDPAASDGEEERVPESGRELVGAPYQSARVAVAAPAAGTDELLDLGGPSEVATPPVLGETFDLDGRAPEATDHAADEEHEPPPESSRSLRAAPASPSTSSVVEARDREESPDQAADAWEGEREVSAEAALDLDDQTTSKAPRPDEITTEFVVRPESIAPSVEREPTVAGPIVEASRPAEVVAFEAPAHSDEPPPTRISHVPSVRSADSSAAHEVELQAAGAHADAGASARQTVSIEAAVIVPTITPQPVARFIEAARAPLPETFGALLDAALDL